MRNAYPEKPILQYQRTQVAMADVVLFIQQAAFDREVKRMAYCMFRNESGNGQYGVNENYSGFQADGARWPDQYTPLITGIVEKAEAGTGKPRLFLAFASWHGSVDMLLAEVYNRGLYVGPPEGALNLNATIIRYVRDWVTGNAEAEPSDATLAEFTSMYGQAEALFS